MSMNTKEEIEKYGKFADLFQPVSEEELTSLAKQCGCVKFLNKKFTVKDFIMKFVPNKMNVGQILMSGAQYLQNQEISKKTPTKKNTQTILELICSLQAGTVQLSQKVADEFYELLDSATTDNFVTAGKMLLKATKQKENWIIEICKLNHKIKAVIRRAIMPTMFDSRDVIIAKLKK